MLCWEVMQTAPPQGFNVPKQEGRVVITINFQKMAVKHLDLTKPVCLFGQFQETERKCLEGATQVLKVFTVGGPTVWVSQVTV